MGMRGSCIGWINEDEANERECLEVGAGSYAADGDGANWGDNSVKRLNDI